jgi:hypothetical protein
VLKFQVIGTNLSSVKKAIKLLVGVYKYQNYLQYVPSDCSEVSDQAVESQTV